MRVVPKYGDLHEDWPQECRGNCDVIKSYSFLINISPWSGATGKETSKEGAAGEGAGGGGGRGGGGGASILSAGPSRAPLSSSSSLRSSPPHSNLNNSFGRAGGEGSLIRSRRRDIRSSSSPFFRFLRFFDFIYFSTELFWVALTGGASKITILFHRGNKFIYVFLRIILLRLDRKDENRGICF